jgi:hypothetical protein
VIFFAGSKDLDTVVDKIDRVQKLEEIFLIKRGSMNNIVFPVKAGLVEENGGLRGEMAGSRLNWIA